MEDINKIKVGMADLKIAEKPDLLTTLGLGSCVGIIIYDRYNGIAGMLHAMLPSSKEIRNNQNKAKFVDSGIDKLLYLILDRGGRKNFLEAKLTGGSQMFDFDSSNEILRIGSRNILAAKEKLEKEGIELVAEDTGGNFGRTIVFNTSDKSLYIRTIGHGEKII